MIQTLFFYLFAFLTIASSVLVIFARNPVHSVLWLIFAFFSSAGLFIILGAEFVAMLMVIVYVGAVAVLFLFVVMMLEVDLQKLKIGFWKNLPLALVVAGLFLLNLVAVIAASSQGVRVISRSDFPVPDVVIVSNTHALGRIIYTDFVLQFQAAGLILFVAMIGSILLTHRTRPGVRRQNISKQVARQVEDAIEIKEVEIGKGIDGIKY